MKQLNNFYNLDKIRLEIDQLVDTHGWYENSQISLQSPDGNFMTGNGKIESNPGYTELDFVACNAPDNWEITRFITDNNLYRTRIMKLNPKVCYSYHRDRSSRVHLAVDTHENCFFVKDKTMFHIPADGKPYWIDTRIHHTALNATLDFERIHIVGCVKD